MSDTPSEIASRVLELEQELPGEKWKPFFNAADGVHGVGTNPSYHDVAICSEEKCKAFHTLSDRNCYDPAKVTEAIAYLRNSSPALARAYQQLEQENATLRAELADAKKTIHEALTYFHDSGGRSMVAGDTIPQMFNALTDEMDDAKTERDEARKEAATLRELAEGLKADKERLDWLEANNIRILKSAEFLPYSIEISASGQLIRTAIDAARYRAACPGEGQTTESPESA
jgi:DNA repair exonuclease SbcCD ATPase subunit